METKALNQTPKSIDDGGLAFPGMRTEQVGMVSDFGLPGSEEDDRPTYGEVQHPGMSLRDWFAGQALNGAWASSVNEAVAVKEGQTVDEAIRAHWDGVASAAYIAADAMIAARKAGA